MISAEPAMGRIHGSNLPSGLSSQKNTCPIYKDKCLPAVPPCLALFRALSAECHHTLCPLRRLRVAATWPLYMLRIFLHKTRCCSLCPQRPIWLKLHLSGLHRPGLAGKPSLSFTPSSSVLLLIWDYLTPEKDSCQYGFF